MENLKAKSTSADTAWELVWRCWSMARVNYNLSLLIVVVLVALVALSSLPLVGSLIAAISGAFVQLIFLQAASRWERDEPSSFEEVFSILKDKSLLNRLFPLLATSAALSLLPAATELLQMGPGIRFILALLTLFLLAVVNMAYPIMLFNPGWDLKDALKLSLEGLLKNIFPMLLASFMLVILAAMTLIAAVIPFFLITVPMYISFHYLWYRVIFEDLVLESEDKSII